MPSRVKKNRSRTASATETAVLVGARRRCALCYGLFGDLKVKAGQLAHVDRNRSNSSERNLAFLCLKHHDQYDSKTSQSKGLTPDELQIYRAALEDAVRAAFKSEMDPRDLPVSAPPAAAYRLAGDFLFLPFGHASPYFATDGDNTCELAEPRVLIVGGTLTELDQLFPIFEQAARAKVPLLTVADGFTDGVISTMILNTQNKILPACAIALAEPSRREVRRAIAQFATAIVFNDEAGRALNRATLGDLGRLASAKADGTSTIMKAAARDTQPAVVLPAEREDGGRYPRLENPAHPTQEDVRKLAEHYGLLKTWPTNPHLRIKTGDISFWHDEGLSAAELDLTFEARRLVLERAEKSGTFIATQGDLSHEADRLRGELARIGRPTER